jgi:catalase
MKAVRELIQKRQIEHFKKADPQYGQGVEQGLARSTPGDPRLAPVIE